MGPAASSPPTGPTPGDPADDIVLVHGSQRFDGHRIGFLQFVDALARAGVPHRVYTCVDPSSQDRFAIDGTAVRGRRLPPGGALEAAANRYFGVYARRLAHVPARVVHVNDVYLANFARTRPRVVVHVADLAKLTTRFYPRAPSWLHNRMLRDVPRAAAIVTESAWVRDDVVRTLRVPADRVVVAHPYAALSPPEDPFPPPVEPPTPDAPHRLLYVAVDRPHKNVARFLATLAALGPAYRGIFVGRLAPSSAALADRLGIRSRLETAVGVPDLTPVYRSAQAYLHPSRYEGLGFPLLEAMSQGVPIVASTATCIPEIVGDGGRVVDPDDGNGWVEAVRALADPSAHAEAARASRRRAGAFGPAPTAAALRRAYEIAAPR